MVPFAEVQLHIIAELRHRPFMLRGTRVSSHRGVIPHEGVVPGRLILVTVSVATGPAVIIRAMIFPVAVCILRRRTLDLALRLCGTLLFAFAVMLAGRRLGSIRTGLRVWRLLTTIFRVTVASGRRIMAGTCMILVLAFVARVAMIVLLVMFRTITAAVLPAFMFDSRLHMLARFFVRLVHAGRIVALRLGRFAVRRRIGGLHSFLRMVRTAMAAVAAYGVVRRAAMLIAGAITRLMALAVVGLAVGFQRSIGQLVVPMLTSPPGGQLMPGPRRLFWGPRLQSVLGVIPRAVTLARPTVPMRTVLAFLTNGGITQGT
jgi:hypothetical protein